jgi:hypothetical protein
VNSVYVFQGESHGQIYFGCRRVKRRRAFARASSRPRLWCTPVSSGSIHGHRKSKRGQKAGRTSYVSAIAPFYSRRRRFLRTMSNAG